MAVPSIACIVALTHLTVDTAWVHVVTFHVIDDPGSRPALELLDAYAGSKLLPEGTGTCGRLHKVCIAGGYHYIQLCTSPAKDAVVVQYLQRRSPYLPTVYRHSHPITGTPWRIRPQARSTRRWPST